MAKCISLMALKTYMLAYPNYVSFECGCRSDDRTATLTAAVSLLRKQWDEA